MNHGELGGDSEIVEDEDDDETDSVCILRDSLSNDAVKTVTVVVVVVTRSM